MPQGGREKKGNREEKEESLLIKIQPQPQYIITIMIIDKYI